MELYFYNSLSNQKEKFTSIENNKVKMYCCGPTVHDYAHIGNFRSFLFSDLIHRLLKILDYEVTFVMNITDIDDKIIAKVKNTSLQKYTKIYTEAFFQHLQKLKCLPASFYPKATETISEIIVMIKDLLQKGNAYRSQDGSIYFKIASFDDYGKLSNIQLEQQKVGASQRIDADEYDKENASDFVLWKTYQKEDGNIFWQDDVLGKGRPGWHIECSAMSKKTLGNHFDIHTGGVDNKFPHHENEIAQSECCNESSYVNYWLHCSHLMVDNQKMSKSLGNFFTLEDLIKKGYSTNSIRYMLLSTHYRNEYNFKLNEIESTTKAINKVNRLIGILLNSIHSEKNKENLKNNYLQELAKFKKQFFEFLCDDLNTAGSFGIVFTAVHFINQNLKDFSLQEKKNALDFFKLVNKIFDVFVDADIDKKKLLQEKPSLQEKSIPEEILLLAKERQQWKQQKNYQKADEIRNEISAQGYFIIDTSNGFEVKFKN